MGNLVKYGLPDAILGGMSDREEYPVVVICAKCNTSGVALLWDEHRRWSFLDHESDTHLRSAPDGFSAVETHLGFKFICNTCGTPAEVQDYGS
jgi:hypothetical protein